MSTCWKCGKEISEGAIECEYGCAEVPRRNWPTDEQVAQAIARQKALTVQIDWDKVKSFEDLRAICAALWDGGIFFPYGIPEAIKPFLKPQGGSSPGEDSRP